MLRVLIRQHEDIGLQLQLAPRQKITLYSNRRSGKKIGQEYKRLGKILYWKIFKSFVDFRRNFFFFFFQKPQLSPYMSWRISPFLLNCRCLGISKRLKLPKSNKLFIDFASTTGSKKKTLDAEHRMFLHCECVKYFFSFCLSDLSQWLINSENFLLLRIWISGVFEFS